MEKQQLDNRQQPGGAKKALEAVKQWLSRFIVPNRGDCAVIVCAVLYFLICANGIADQCQGQGHPVGGFLRSGQDFPIWRPNNPGR